MAQLLATSTELLRKITQLEATQATYPLPPVAAIECIPLDAVKVIHEFTGDKKVYRSWLMKQIENHQTTPKYADK